MRNRSGIGDGHNLKSDASKGTNSRFTAGAWTLNIDIDLAKALIVGTSSSGFASKLSGEWGALFSTFIAKGASATPGNYIALGVSDSDDGVIECGMDMSHTASEVSLNLLLAGGSRLLFAFNGGRICSSGSSWSCGNFIFFCHFVLPPNV
jgi:hypothetical protein